MIISLMCPLCMSMLIDLLLNVKLKVKLFIIFLIYIQGTKIRMMWMPTNKYKIDGSVIYEDDGDELCPPINLNFIPWHPILCENIFKINGSSVEY